MQRGSTVWTVTRFPQAVQANWPFAKVPAGQNSTYSSSPAIVDETMNCDSSTSSPFTSGPWIASRSTLLVGPEWKIRQQPSPPSLQRLAAVFMLLVLAAADVSGATSHAGVTGAQARATEAGPGSRPSFGD